MIAMPTKGKKNQADNFGFVEVSKTKTKAIPDYQQLEAEQRKRITPKKD